MSKSKVNFVCNDCDRGFVHESAWKYHGERTGHNINGDLPGHHQREISELRTKLAKVEEAYRLTNEERARLSLKLNAIISVVQL